MGGRLFGGIVFVGTVLTGAAVGAFLVPVHICAAPAMAPFTFATLCLRLWVQLWFQLCLPVQFWPWLHLSAGSALPHTLIAPLPSFQ